MSVIDQRIASLSTNTGGVSSPPDPAALPHRRSFSEELKLAIVREHDDAEFGAKGAVLRRHHVYSSQVTQWRRARDRDAVLTKARRVVMSPAEAEKLQRENERLKSDLRKSRAALELMGKASALLELLAESAPEVKK
jgi:transposase